MGPWSHVNYTNVVGELDFGFAAQLAFMNLQTDLTGLTQRWFDYWLKGIDSGISKQPPIKLFIMGDPSADARRSTAGPGVWRDDQECPLPRTRFTPFYRPGR